MERDEIVRVVVTQGYCLLSGALVERLRMKPWLDVCATASDPDEMRAKVEQHRPHKKGVTH